MTEKSLSEIDLKALSNRTFFPSPAAWEDQVLYFMLLDRFSDGKETNFRGNDGKTVADGSTPPFQPTDGGNAIRTDADAAAWRDAGGRWVGGNLRGLTTKIGYLERLGITALWVSPVFKQISFQDTYHGYGIQNFIDVDPHFGTREDLKTLVDTAHANGIYVILDIILNHSGNVFSYNPDRYPTQNGMDSRWDGNPYNVQGFNDRTGNPSLPFVPGAAVGPDDAIWPSEMRDPASFTRKGHISNWDYFPEYLEGDFCDLKDITLGWGDIDDYTPSPALRSLCKAYKFWMAYLDIDGFRVDTVKHMDPGAARFFNSVVHEFSQSLGKENFYVIGEITGGRENAFNTLETVGMDAVLGIDDVQPKMDNLVKGSSNPADYFDLFRNSLLVQKDSHVWFRNKVVTQVDDHDKVCQGNDKARFCAGSDAWPKLLVNVLGLNTCTLGIPCVYYGTEQAFDGQGDNDRYIREAMFGGAFGAFRSKGRHFFNENAPAYVELAKILAVRRDKEALRRGRQYLREISGDGSNFGLPQIMGDRMLSVVPWSRLFNDEEILLALNTDPDNPREAWTVVDAGLHQNGDTLRCLYSTDPTQIGQLVAVNEIRPGLKAVPLTVPAAGFVIFE